MKNFDSGVIRYIKGSCTLTVGFPVDLKGRAYALKLVLGV